MKNKILGLALSIAFATSAVGNVYASDNQSNIAVETKQQSEERQYIFDVVKVDESTVELMYNGEITNDAIIIEDFIGNSNIKLDKTLFDEDVNVKDTYIVKTMDRIFAINTENIKKDKLKLHKKYEKPMNMDIKDVPNDATIKDFIIESINQDQLYPTAVLSEADNPSSKYSISLDMLQEENPVVGYMYKIYWDGVTLESYPAQFGKIYRVEPVLLSTHDDNKDSAEIQKETREFEVIEISENGVTLAETKNKDNKYNISFKDLKDENPVIGDRYMITWSGNSTRSYPAQFIDITDVEKWMKKDSAKLVSKDKLGEAIKKAEGIVLGDNTYTKESVDAYKKAYDEAKKVNDNADADQTLVNKATDDLLAAIDNLSQKEGVIKKEFKISQFIEKGGKTVELQSVDYPDKKFTLNFESLNDKDARIGDRYIVTISKVDPKASPFEMGEITKIEKVVATNEDKKSDSDVKKDDKKDQVVHKKDNAPKENKQSMFGNPKTGVASVAPLLGVIAGASALLKKKDK